MLKLYKKAKEPFYFCTRLNLSELLGVRARNLTDLINMIKAVPDSSIFYHTHMFLEQKQDIIPEHTNEFAYWVSHVLGEHVLGEELASIDLVEFKSIRAIREKLIMVLEHNLFDRTDSLRVAARGMEFEFMKSHSFILPTKYSANSLFDFIRALKEVSVNTLYFHFFESRLRLEKGINDFSCWIDMSLGFAELAEKVASIDPYTHTLEGLRHSLVRTLEKG
ncbi:MAG: DUF5752 family protein [Candidatus Omnitrophica bacterium]|nr:DUF5752 family protein [Candidatus Omnitrophota bacterium]